MTLAITQKGDLLVTGIIAFKKLNSKVVRIPLGQIGDAFFGEGSGKTANPIIEDVLMDATGKLDGGTIAVEVDDNLFLTSWRAVGLTKCKL